MLKPVSFRNLTRNETDEEVTVPKGSDEKFVSKINQIFDENSNTKSVFFLRNHKSAVMFTVRHFAGDVHYNATNFLEKNRDALAESLMKLLQSSTISIIQPQKVGEEVAAAPSSKKNSRMTLCGKFKSDLDNLMTILRSTVPHFVRCIKPNIEQVPTKFEPTLVLNQLKYSGLFEAIRIRKSGYEVRLTHEQFITRYKHCLTSAIPPSINKKTMVKEYCEYILEKLSLFIKEDPYFVERRRTLEKASLALQKRAGGTAAASAPAAKSLAESVVGKTRVFFRRQLLKILFDEYRDTCAENVVLPIQRIIRGFLARCYFQKMMGATKKDNAERRKQEAAERSFMAIEDELTYQQELIWRNDKELQKRLYDAKLSRMKEEKQKLQNRRLTAVTRLQAWIRAKIYGQRGKVFLCERLLEIALQSRDETLMQRALQRPKELKITSKLIQLYRKHVKNLILEIMNEKFVQTTLQEAIEIRSIPLLTSAIQLVKDNSMSYLSEVTFAKQLLTELGNHRILLFYLQDELSKCNNMASFMAKYDIIDYLVKESLQYPDLQGEEVVHQASYRLSKIGNCYTLRQQLRHALEICSPTKMLKTWKQRQSYVKIFGETFLEEEANAIENIINMLKYKQTLLTPFSSTSSSLSRGKRKDSDGISTAEREEIVSIAESINQDGSASNEEGIDEPNKDDDGSDDERSTENKRVEPGERSKSKPSTKKELPEEEDDDEEDSFMKEKRQLNMHEIYHLVIHNTLGKASSEAQYQQMIDALSSLDLGATATANATSSSDQIIASDTDFIYLPRFVREPLNQMRLAHNHQGMMK